VNCTLIQRRLLSAEQPDQPEADVQSHLAECPTCRAWQRRLVQIERLIPQLPVPPSSAKAELLGRLLGTPPAQAVRPPAIAQPPAVWQSALTPGPKERGLRKLSLALTLAATLLVFALAWWAWPHNHGPAPSQHPRPDPMVQKFEERLAGILRADTPRDRILQLADLAKEVHGEANRAKDNAEKLDWWARFYARVVGEHLLEQAHQLPQADRPALLKEIASGLSETESAASRLAAELKSRAPKSAASFDQIAFAARHGGKELHALIHG